MTALPELCPDSIAPGEGGEGGGKREEKEQ